jgi:hypothetical protein
MVEAALAARKPMKRKRAKKRQTKTARCFVRGCKRPLRVIVPLLMDDYVSEAAPEPPRIEGYCLTHAKREADRLCRLIVLNRDDWTCQRCGATAGIQWCHILTRSELSIRWEPKNSLALCAGCHVYMTHRPVEWLDWIDDHFGPYRMGTLRKLRRDSIARGDKPDYAALIADLRVQASQVKK